MKKARFGTIDQIGYLVSDLDQSIERWLTQLGVGPWMVFRNVTLQGHYLNQPVTVTMNVGLAYQGDTQIELIQATNNSASPYRDAQGQPILGMHHVAWVVDDIDAAIKLMTVDGLQMVFEASNPATRVAYFEDASEPGVRYEVIHGAGMREMIQQGIAAARDWDGTNPIHVIDAMSDATSDTTSAEHP
ncbi:VOC family protein [Paraburkholderia pallida]|uniref:VOC family protein n=1 Tax=Paraburkholderia pallida TaxID=2547399 RepID=A0A4P7CTL1_9BURK|nr:VOC family protein [Paraburkholderia pallida]QBQ97173.1 VOC family protein [Paraburkholderia pallida]